MKKLVAALEEQLATDVYLQKEQQKDAGTEYDALHSKVESDQKKPEEKVEPNEADQTTDTEPSEDDGADQEASEPVTESIKHLTYVSEGMFDNFFGNATESNLGAFAWAGVTLSVDVIKKVFKGVLWLFAKVFSLLISSYYMLDKYLERRKLQFSNIQKDIEQLKAAVKIIVDKGNVSEDVPEVKFTNASTINTLKTGDSVDVKSNVVELNRYIDYTVKGITEQINNETGAIKHLVSSGRSRSTQLPNRVMALRPDAIGMREGTVTGYETSSEYVTQYRSEQTLPGDVVMIATFPKKDLLEKEDIIRGYNDSSIILGMDISHFKEIESLDYMNTAQLAEFVNSLDALCASCIAHEAMYTKIKESKDICKSMYKNYFSFILHATKKIKTKETFLEEIYLKSMFIDKVYLHAMFDIHDYVAKVLVAGTRYAKNNIEALS